MLRLKKSIDELFKDGAAIERAIREGVRAALLRHHKLGQPIVIYRDGKVVHVPPEEIPAELERSGNVPDTPAR
jgi:hypothetical protein